MRGVFLGVVVPLHWLKIRLLGEKLMGTRFQIFCGGVYGCLSSPSSMHWSLLYDLKMKWASLITECISWS